MQIFDLLKQGNDEELCVWAGQSSISFKASNEFLVFRFLNINFLAPPSTSLITFAHKKFIYVFVKRASKQMLNQVVNELKFMTSVGRVRNQFFFCFLLLQTTNCELMEKLFFFSLLLFSSHVDCRRHRMANTKIYCAFMSVSYLNKVFNIQKKKCTLQCLNIKKEI